MKRTKLGPLLAVTLSLELMLAPIIPAVHADAELPATPTNKSKSSVAETVNASINAVGTIMNSVIQAGSPMSPQMAGDMVKLRDQLTPQPDKYFNPQKLLQIPGLANYLALNNINPNMLNCPTLPTTLHEARPEVCRIGITNDKGLHQQQQLDQMFTYYNQYFQIEKAYKNYSADSNTEGQPFGIGCMNNAMNILNGFFKYRLDELDKLTTNLEAMQNQFREASRSDLDALEEAVAVLEGDSAMADKVRSKNPDLFDFAKRFDNAACNSMFAGEDLNNRGRSGGLNNINSDLKKTLTTKNGKYSGESYSKAHANVVEDINQLADKVAKQFQLNYPVLSKDGMSYGKFLGDLPDLVSSPNGTNRAISADMFADVQTKFNESFVKLNEQKSTILSELRAAGVSGDAAVNLLGNTTSSNFDSEVATIENKLKNSCFQSTLSDIGKDRLLNRIYDPSASKHANEHASNYLKDKLAKIIDNPETSLEKKLAELRTLESQTDSRYYLKMDNSYEVQEVDANGNLKTKVVGASIQKTPGAFFSDLINNCNAQFKANKLNNKLSGAGAIQKLRDLNQQYKELAKTQSADMRNELRKKLVECSSADEANNTVPGSCTPERFNTSSPGFCANAAFSCSKNMQACSKQADNMVKEIKQQKTARVNNYKALVQKNKMDIVKMFDSALTRYMQDGEALRGLFGAGFASPVGVKREVPESERYLSEFQQATSKSPDGRLLLEDPDKYVAMFKDNIALLKKSVKDQQDQVLGGNSVNSNKPGLLADHIKKTEKNYRTVATDAAKFSEECRNKHDSAVAAAEQQRAKQMEEQNKKMAEVGEKRNEFCNLYGMAANNPQAICGELQADFVKASLQAAGSANARQDVADLMQYCRQYGNFDERKAGSAIDADMLCIDANSGSPRFLNAQSASQVREQCKAMDEALASCANVSTKDGESTRSNSCATVMKSHKEKIEAAYKYVAQAPLPVGSVTLSEAPEYCAAGNGTGRDNIAKSLQMFSETLAQQIGAGRQ